MSTLATDSLLSESTTPLHTARPSFIGLVRGELFKAVRQWTPWIALVLLLGIIFLPYLLLFTTSDLKELITSPDYSYFYGRAAIGLALLRAFGGITLLIITARVIGQEYSLGTIRVVLARGVGRVQLLLAKMLAVSILALGILAIGLIEVALLVTGQVQIVTGSLHALTSLPTSVWHDLGLYLLAIVISMAVTILMATALSVLFRSLAGALSGAIAWFPIDNMLVLMLLLMAELTKADFWLSISAYLLGPNLNTMAGVLAKQDGSVWNFGFAPRVAVDSTHTLVVTLVYALIFLVVAIGLTWKRDVKE
jgi:ABC-type transport system involved in multi-copper enzyme maturation permease subunit